METQQARKNKKIEAQYFWPLWKDSKNYYHDKNYFHDKNYYHLETLELGKGLL